MLWWSKKRRLFCTTSVICRRSCATRVYPKLSLASSSQIFECMLSCRNENQYRCNESRNYVPVQATKPLFFPSWWSTTKTVEKFKYFCISFTSDGRQNSELGMSKCSNAPSSPICGTETWALHQGKAIHFPISLCSDSDLWP